jgi:hypothetical protein
LLCGKCWTFNIEEISLELVDILTKNDKTQKQMKLYFLTIFLRVFKERTKKISLVYTLLPQCPHHLPFWQAALYKTRLP